MRNQNTNNGTQDEVVHGHFECNIETMIAPDFIKQHHLRLRDIGVVQRMGFQEVENWRVLLMQGELGNKLAQAYLKNLRTAVRAWNRLEREISYAEEMSALIDFGEFTGSTFDDSRDNLLDMLSDKFGVHKFDIVAMETEDTRYPGVDYNVDDDLMGQHMGRNK